MALRPRVSEVSPHPTAQAEAPALKWDTTPMARPVTRFAPAASPRVGFIMEETMTPERMNRRGLLQVGLGGVAALGPLPLATIGADMAMADSIPETVVYVSNA